MRPQPSPRQLVESVTARPGHTRALGTRVLAAEAGAVDLEIPRRADLLQFNGFFHGGVIAALADHAAGGAVTTALPPGRIAVTIDLHVNYLAPADGERLVARARAAHVGTTVSVATVEVSCPSSDEERVCALATATLRTVELPTP